MFSRDALVCCIHLKIEIFQQRFSTLQYVVYINLARYLTKSVLVATR